ncbi:MAG: HAD-IA family hydrolase [bacterium]|nr:HAD-IA family hydrolase [bacterium]
MSSKKKYTIKELREICQRTGPSKQTQSVFGLTVRMVSIYFTKLFIKLGATPNHITVSGTIIYLVGTGLIATGQFAYGLVGFALLILSTILDACDGELFRFRGYREGYGFYVEPTTHDIMYGLQFTLFGYGAFLQTGQLWILFFGVAGSTFKLLFRLHEARFFFNVTQVLPKSKHVDKTKHFPEQSRLTKLIYRAYRNTATSTGMLLPLLIAVIFQRLDIFVIIYGSGYVLLWAGLLSRQIWRFRKIIRQVYDYTAYVQTLRARLRHKKLIIFDLDGTLVDTMGIFTEIASYLMAWKYGVLRLEARKGYIRTSGIPFFQQLEELFPGRKHNQSISDIFEERKIAATDHLEITPEERQVVELLYRRGYTLAISSNNYTENVERFVQFSGLPFAHVCGYHKGFAKGEEHFSYILERAGVSQDEALFVGDTLSDMRKARAAGIDFIGKVGTFTRDEFEAEYPNVVTIHSLTELRDMLDSDNK